MVGSAAETEPVYRSSGYYGTKIPNLEPAFVLVGLTRGSPSGLRRGFGPSVSQRVEQAQADALRALSQAEKEIYTSLASCVMKHRADIDGLRAVAIVPVLLFHAGIARVSGGFTGVDVFFVVSGYLITGLILDDIAKGSFSVAHFYERRVRRILPALFVLLICASLAAYVLLMPDDAREFGRSLFATMLFSSNVLFSMQTGYFQAPAEMKPLLHTWSLAVEEQFYILYPLVLFLVTRYLRKHYSVVLLSALGLSLAFSIWYVHTHHSAAFYSSVARAWELLLGGILAIQVIRPVRHRLIANVLAFLGLVLLVYSFLTLSGTRAFPGVNALYPTLGAALIIYSGAGRDTFVAKVLSTKPVAFIGLISYSLYLWHWALLVFLKYYLVRRLSGWEIAAVMGVAVVIATLSWRFVESPFRGRRRLMKSRRLLFAGAAAGSVAFVLFGGLLFLTGGLPSRFSSQVLGLLAGKGDYWARRDQCMGQICAIGNSAPGFLLWGDSHAGAIAPLFEQMAAANHKSGAVAFVPACAPLLGLKRYDQDDVKKCTRFNQSVLEFIKSNHISNVFLHARWGLYAEGSRYRQERGGPALLTADRNPKEDYRELESLLPATIQELQRLHVNITIIASVPEVEMDVPTVLARNVVTGKVSSLAPHYPEFLERQARAFKLLSQVAEKYRVRVIYPHQTLCNYSSCRIVSENHALYVDDDHLSTHGAMYLMPTFAPLL